jgi:hypothetical protein
MSQIKNLKIEDCKDVADFVKRKFDYYKQTLKMTTFKAKVKLFISELTPNLKTFFKDYDVSKLYNETKITVFLEYNINKSLNTNLFQQEMDVEIDLMKQIDIDFQKPSFQF